MTTAYVDLAQDPLSLVWYLGGPASFRIEYNKTNDLEYFFERFITLTLSRRVYVSRTTIA